ncbi:hypothetical protein HD806DRAFT_257184 [Xylariaceae sp. AK1471]|nr:hypothetical protein HD806DRAFT_257184 [Xylariaceae sp. AK1471]
MAPSGSFSWCPRALSDMPISSSDDFERPTGDHVLIHLGGYASGTCHWRFLESEDTQVGALVLYQPPLLRSWVLNGKLQFYRLEQRLSRTPPDSVLQTTLRHWTKCLLLHEALNPNVPTILIETLGLVTDEEGENIINCRYIATVEVG